MASEKAFFVDLLGLGRHDGRTVAGEIMLSRPASVRVRAAAGVAAKAWHPARKKGKEAMTQRECDLFPIEESVIGYVLSFEPVGPMYQPMAALAVIAGLNGKQFSGACECYIRPGTPDGEYVMALALDPGAESVQPDAEWWTSFIGAMAAACEDDPEVCLLAERCRPMAVGEMRAAFLHAGTAEFVEGLPHLIADPDCSDPNSPFSGLCKKIRDKYDS
jgi:hypothetical protein